MLKDLRFVLMLLSQIIIYKWLGNFGIESRVFRWLKDAKKNSKDAKANSKNLKKSKRCKNKLARCETNSNFFQPLFFKVQTHFNQSFLNWHVKGF